MGIEFDCVKCGKEMFAREQFAGRTVQCPECATLLSIPVQSGSTPEVVPGEVTAAPPPSSPPPEPPPESPPVSPPTPAEQNAPAAAPVAQAAVGTDMVRCQQCGQAIHRDARMCRFCGKTQDPGLQRQVDARGQVLFPKWKGKRGALDIGAAIEVGIEVLKKYIGMGVVISMLALMMVGGVFGLAILVMLLMIPTKPGAAGAPQIIAMVMAGVLFLIGVLLSAVVMGGWMQAAIKMTDSVMGRDVEPEIGDLMAGFKKIPALLGANFLIWIIVGGLWVVLAIISMVIPFFFLVAMVYMYHLSFRLMLVIPLIMDQNLGAVDAMRMSWSATRGHTLMMFVLSFVTMLIMGVAGLIPFVGQLFAYVFMMGVAGSGYRQLTTR